MRFVAALFLGALLIGCGHLEPPQRTLPIHIESIYIAMPQNMAMEYGLEEELTRALHEEFLADGRIAIERETHADARLDVTITDFQGRVRSVNADDYPLFEQATITAESVLREPHRSDPTVTVESVAATTFIADPRRSDFVPEMHWRADLMSTLALEIVSDVLTAEPVSDEFL